VARVGLAISPNMGFPAAWMARRLASLTLAITSYMEWKMIAVAAGEAQETGRKYLERLRTIVSA